MNLESLQAEVSAALEPGFRGQLLARGQARAMILRDGVLPPGAPQFAATLPYDLIAYGQALLLSAVRIRGGGGDEELARRAFMRAGEAIEAAVTNGPPDDPERGFLRMLSAVAFHLGRSSARAYSMLNTSLEKFNLSRLEHGLAKLILRSFDQLEEEIIRWQVEEMALDERLVENLTGRVVSTNDPDGSFEDAILGELDTALCDKLYSGLSSFLLALETGEESLVKGAIRDFETGLAASSDVHLVPQWWCFRLAIHMIEDLWQMSYHRLLPPDLPGSPSEEWRNARSLFIASLYRRRRANIELWPSQIEGATRAVDQSDNLVVSLPTSAGKTRIAELCILRCVSEGKRTVFVTPLRALSAQTELALRQAFRPLGKSISSLYGSMGTSGFEEDALRSRDIVVATPEKLDFALRNDPSILDDVGLVVLDEGHMIGIGEREVRYEVQIQRLLTRPDSQDRRIVCLSAILPDDEKCDDFVKWIRKDRSGNPVRSKWRPTRLRFGEVLWANNTARLELRVGSEQPFIPTFFEGKAPLRGKRTELFPRSQRELAIATTWRLLEDDHSVIIYCPQRVSVGPYAKAIVDLVAKGFIDSAFSGDDRVLGDALAIGGEWLGEKHPVVRCLALGVAIHHGALPTAFRHELERLLRNDVLKVTVCSPTLAQGLNLTATSIVMHDLKHRRDGKWEAIPASEFKNVVGRAGRAFVDVEGLVLYPIFTQQRRLRQQWQDVLGRADDHEMESGLLQLVIELLRRMHTLLGTPSFRELTEYVLNNAAAWDFGGIPGKGEGKEAGPAVQWRQYLAYLDTALLSLMGEDAVSVEKLAVRLDELLSNSLWARQIARYNETMQRLLQGALLSRTRVIWEQTTAAQRRGYFLAGVGLAPGQALDSIAGESNPLLIEANAAILEGDGDRAAEAVVGLAERLFEIEPFIPRPFPEKWREVLQRWVRGEPVKELTDKKPDDLLRFIENGIVYKLCWGVEAVRVRAVANEDVVDLGGIDLKIDDFETGLLVPCLETGTLHPCAARLIQAGFASRMAASKAVRDTRADFTNMYEMRSWLQKRDVVTLSADDNWPTAESHQRWVVFVKRHIRQKDAAWSLQRGEFPVTWRGPTTPSAGEIVRLRFAGDGSGTVLSPSLARIGTLNIRLRHRPVGLFDARVEGKESVRYQYRGPSDIAIAR